jgi:hypothetical protein
MRFIRTRPTSKFGPDKRSTALWAVLAVVPALIALFSNDRAGQLMLIGMTVTFAFYSISDVIFSPRLTVSSEGVVICTPFLRGTFEWRSIESVHLDDRRRFGIRTVTLEIDLGSTIAVFSQRSLGVDPQLAAELVQAYRHPDIDD